MEYFKINWTTVTDLIHHAIINKGIPTKAFFINDDEEIHQVILLFKGTHFSVNINTYDMDDKVKSAGDAYDLIREAIV